MLVTVKISYDTARARRDALKGTRDALGCAIYSTGVDGSFSVDSGRVVLHEPEREKRRA